MFTRNGLDFSPEMGLDFFTRNWVLIFHQKWVLISHQKMGLVVVDPALASTLSRVLLVKWPRCGRHLHADIGRRLPAKDGLSAACPAFGPPRSEGRGPRSRNGSGNWGGKTSRKSRTQCEPTSKYHRASGPTTPIDARALLRPRPPRRLSTPTSRRTTLEQASLDAP